MQFLRVAAVGAVAVFSFPHAASADSLLVRAIVDGATIDVAGIGHVRLLGIEPPARGHAAAPVAREKLTQLVWRRWVRLEFEPGTRSRRHAYVVREDGLFVNAAMLREGLARVVERVSLTRLTELERAEAEARSSRRGLWASR
jgi:endonuclease YncB( thermonuclease family)